MIHILEIVNGASSYHAVNDQIRRRHSITSKVYESFFNTSFFYFQISKWMFFLLFVMTESSVVVNFQKIWHTIISSRVN